MSETGNNDIMNRNLLQIDMLRKHEVLKNKKEIPFILFRGGLPFVWALTLISIPLDKVRLSVE